MVERANVMPLKNGLILNRNDEALTEGKYFTKNN